MIKKVMRSASITFQDRNPLSVVSPDDAKFQPAVPADPADPYSMWQRVDSLRPCVVDKCDIVPDLIDIICSDFKTTETMGFRKILSKTAAMANNTSIVKKDLADVITWFTNKDIKHVVDHIARGMILHGVKQGDRVVLFMETRIEWLLTFFAIMKIGGSVRNTLRNAGRGGHRACHQ